MQSVQRALTGIPGCGTDFQENKFPMSQVGPLPHLHRRAIPSVLLTFCNYSVDLHGTIKLESTGVYSFQCLLYICYLHTVQIVQRVISQNSSPLNLDLDSIKPGVHLMYAVFLELVTGRLFLIPAEMKNGLSVKPDNLWTSSSSSSGDIMLGILTLRMYSWYSVGIQMDNYSRSRNLSVGGIFVTWVHWDVSWTIARTSASHKSDKTTIQEERKARDNRTTRIHEFWSDESADGELPCDLCQKTSSASGVHDL